MSVTITWAPSTDTDVARYEIERAPASSGPWVDAASIDHNFAGANYAKGRFFYEDAAGVLSDWYRIRAIDVLEQASEWSDPYQATEFPLEIARVLVTGKVLMPDGSVPRKGTITAVLSKSGSVLDGTTSQRVAESVTVELEDDGAIPAELVLVPNDAITPSGTYYLVTIKVTTQARERKLWTEKWQLASTPDPIDIGAVPRLDAIPGLALAATLAGTQAQADAAAASAAAAAASAAAIPTLPAPETGKALGWDAQGGLTNVDTAPPADIQALLAALTHPAGYVPSSEDEIWFLLATPDSTAPEVTAFAVEPTATSLVVAVTSFLATDAVGVTAYLVTESATPPLANDAGWAASAPTHVTASGAGAITFYGYAKDAAGNVSTGLSSTCTITLGDVVAPTVDTFVVPATADSLTVAITSATASDAVGVTAGMITESGTAPLAGAAGWVAWTGSGGLPVGLQSYTTPGAGAKTLRLWAKDAAGNVSSALTAACTFTVSQVATPTFLPIAGSYIADQSVAISCATAGATIHYTTDGSTPTDASPTYSGAISVTSSTTLKAIAMKTGLTDSAVGSATYTLQCATPTFNPPAGTYGGTQSVTIASTTSGAEIRYTTDGSDPSGASTLYTGPVSVPASATLKAIAIKSGRTNSAIGSAAYVIRTTLVPENANFDTAITATTEQTGAWSYLTAGSGAASAGRYASAEMTGPYVGRVHGGNYGDYAYLLYKWTRAEIDAVSLLTFDIRLKQAGRTGVIIYAYDSLGNHLISYTDNDRQTIRISGTWGSNADTTTIAGAAVNVTQAVSFDLKSWVTSKLNAGKTWADVAKVQILLWSDANSGASEIYFDNFR
jgi:hypothetical protein